VAPQSQNHLQEVLAIVCDGIGVTKGQVASIQQLKLQQVPLDDPNLGPTA